MKFNISVILFAIVCERDEICFSSFRFLFIYKKKEKNSLFIACAANLISISVNGIAIANTFLVVVDCDFFSFFLFFQNNNRAYVHMPVLTV